MCREQDTFEHGDDNVDENIQSVCCDQDKFEFDDDDDESHYENDNKKLHRCVSRAMSTAEKSLNSVSKIDRISRIVFPLTYIAINIVYWYLCILEMMMRIMMIHTG